MTRKCVVWDLDDTLWDGVCLEGDVRPRPRLAEVLTALDRRGILHSIASRGDEDLAMSVLRRLGLDEMFLAPRINWEAKPKNILSIAAELGLGTDSFVFVDDDPFEREQVSYMLPEVLTVDAQDAHRLPLMPELGSQPVTPEAARRRTLYLADARRKKAASEYASRREFLEACRMRLVVRSMVDADVPRVLELMTRTHQLNTTGISFSREEVVRRAESIYVADLSDTFGDYGTVGVAIVERCEAWTISFLALSCRVMGRGVERGLLSAVLNRGRAAGYRHAEALIRDTGRNKSMLLLLRFSGFRQVSRQEDGLRTHRIEMSDIASPPPWLSVA